MSYQVGRERACDVGCCLIGQDSELLALAGSFPTHEIRPMFEIIGEDEESWIAARSSREDPDVCTAIRDTDGVAVFPRCWTVQ